MKFSTIATTAFLAGTALAAPGTEMRRARAANRLRSSKPAVHTREGLADISTNNTFVSYSTNWAGAVLESTGFTSVSGTFVAPTPSTTGSGSAWVGIDGDTCQTAILQSGIDFTKSGSSITYDAWYEWYPQYAYDFSGISISGGDTIKVTVTATSKTAGTAVLENVTKGTTVTHTFSGSGDATLCETNAEWIVEAYEENGSQVTLTNFGTVTFSSATAVKSGSTVGPSGATIIDMETSSGSVLVSCTDTSSTVTCKYQ